MSLRVLGIDPSMTRVEQSLRLLRSRPLKRGLSLAMTVIIFFSSPLFAFDLEGKIKVEPPYPKPALLEIDEKHRADCGTQKISPKVKISPEGGVANAVVKLEGNFPKAETTPADNHILDQIQCEFSPHVLLLPQGSTLSILNSEAMLHNVRAFDEKIEMLFNDAMPKKGQILKKRFKEPGRFIFRCGVHHWMHALVIVQEHPFYALTNEEGRFKLSGIPEGDYELSVWHESLGELRRKINPQEFSVEISFPPNAKP